MKVSVTYEQQDEGKAKAEDEWAREVGIVHDA